MKTDKKPILSEQERNRLMENASIVHQIVEEISPKKKKAKWEILKHPLLILAAGAIISGVFVFKYQNRQANIAEKTKAKYELIKETSLYSGRILAMAENVVYLHQKPITGREQIQNTNKNYNAAYDEFNSNFIRIEYNLRIIFKNNDINEGWEEIRQGILTLNNKLDLLHEIPTSEISIKHGERIGRCVIEIDRIKEKLKSLSDLMIEEL